MILEKLVPKYSQKRNNILQVDIKSNSESRKVGCGNFKCAGLVFDDVYDVFEKHKLHNQDTESKRRLQDCDSKINYINYRRALYIYKRDEQKNSSR